MVRATIQKPGEGRVGTVSTFFFDTYALVEILKGNPAYKKYSVGVGIITTKLNLMELYYGLLLQQGKEEAEKRYAEYLPYCVPIDDLIFKRACEFRAEHKKQKLSYVDCLGYVLAKMLGVRFLTGDIQFKELENVEYVK